MAGFGKLFYAMGFYPDELNTLAQDELLVLAEKRLNIVRFECIDRWTKNEVTLMIIKPQHS